MPIRIAVGKELKTKQVNIYKMMVFFYSWTCNLYRRKKNGLLEAKAPKRWLLI